MNAYHWSVHRALERQPCASESDCNWPLFTRVPKHTDAAASAATHPITIKFCARCSWGLEYRWFILRFIKETGVPLKRDQSATRLEESASNWPFIKRPSQVDHGAEISSMTTEQRYIYYTTDEPRALQLTPCDSTEAGKSKDARARTDTQQRRMKRSEGCLVHEAEPQLMVFINMIWQRDEREQTFPLLLYF